MTGFLTAIGEVKYGGWRFPNQIQSNAMIRVNYDDAGVTPISITYFISITCVLHDNPTGGVITDTNTHYGGVLTDLETEFPDIRILLNTPGLELEFSGQGFGTVNVSGNLSDGASLLDINNGPIAKLTGFEPIVANTKKAVRIQWNVEATVPYQEDLIPTATLAQGRIGAISYEMNWSIQPDGRTVRSVQGYLEILFPRSSNTFISADGFRENVRVIVPLGYQRIGNDWTLSPNRKRIIFSITDEESPSDNPLYPGIFKCDLEYSASNQSIGMNNWEVTLSGSIHVAQCVPRWWAWLAFLVVYNSKLKYATTGTVGGTTQQTSAKPSQQGLITRVSISEEVFGRGTHISMSWVLLANLTSLLKASGMWAPTEGTDWASYRNSMSVPWSQRGSNGQRHIPTQDIINLVSNVNPIAVIGMETLPCNGSAVGNQPQTATPNLTPQNTWVYFRNEITKVTESGVVPVQPLFSVPLSALIPNNPTLQAPYQTDTTIQQSAFKQPIYQRQPQVVRLRMRGIAIRAKYPPPEPVLKQYGGKSVTQVGKPVYVSKKLGDFGVPVFCLRWEVDYIVDGVPTGDLSVIQPDLLNGFET